MRRFSVVIPVYNVEDYLALSLDSLRRQTFSDFEAICINDGSSDASLRILNDFAAVDERFVVIDQENKGVSAARNTGMDFATGEIVCFFDSDDLLKQDALERLDAAFKETAADLVSFGGEAYPSFRGTYWLNSVLSPRDYTYHSFSTDILFKERSRPFVWSIACKRGALERSGARFNTTLPLGEDQAFLFSLYPRVQSVAFISDKLIQYRVARSGSAMDTHFEDCAARIRKHLDVCSSIIEDWKKDDLFSRYWDDLLCWIIEFVGFDFFNMPESQRDEVLDSFRVMLEQHFSSDGLRLFIAQRGAAGKIVLCACGERQLAIGIRRKIMMLMFRRQLYGNKAMLQRVTTVLLSRCPAKKLLNRMRRKQIVRAEEERARLEQDWEEADAIAREEALEQIEREAAQAPRL